MSQAPLGHLKKQKAIKKTLDKPENKCYNKYRKKRKGDKKITFKRICKAMLKEENYMDALAYLANKLMKASDIEAEFDRIDEKLWDLAVKADDTIEDATTNALNIISALQIAVDAN